MIHLRMVVPPRHVDQTLTLLKGTSSTGNLVHLRGAVQRPDGDLVMCDVTSEDASSVMANLRELGVPDGGAIAIEPIASQISGGATTTESSTSVSEAVIWEEVDTRTAGMTALSAQFLAMMVLAMLVAMAGIVQATSILIVGAMILGPDFGQVAGVCVAIVERRGRLASRSLATLLIGFAFGIVVSGLVALALKDLWGLPGRALRDAPAPAPGRVLGDRRPQFLYLLRGFPGGHRRNSLPQHGQDRRDHWRSGLGHHHPGRRQRGAYRRLRAVGQRRVVG